MEVPTIALTACGWLATTWLAYRWGLRSQKHAETLKARNALLAIMDKWLAEIPKHTAASGVFRASKKELKARVFGLSCQLTKRGRHAVEKAWANYQALQIKTIGKTIFGGGSDPDPKIVEQERNAMVDALKNLRDTASRG